MPPLQTISTSPFGELWFCTATVRRQLLLKHRLSTGLLPGFWRCFSVYLGRGEIRMNGNLV
jgi:hypothetical protein